MLNRPLLPIEALPAWAHLNNITFDDVEFRAGAKGSGVFAKADIKSPTASEEHEEHEEEGNDSRPRIIMTVPADMILSLGSTHEFAKSDSYLKAVLEASGDFGWVCRNESSLSPPHFRKIHRAKRAVLFAFFRLLVAPFSYFYYVILPIRVIYLPELA